jgi:formate dehydrogenase subunit beta
MARYFKLDTRADGLRDSLCAFLRGLLERKQVDSVLVPCRLPSGTAVAQALVTCPARLDVADPLAPAMPVNSARIVSEMTKVASSRGRMAVVLRPCELRALVELVKLKQARLDNLLVIGADCFGTYALDEYEKLAREGIGPSERLLGSIRRGEDDPSLREACRVCEYPYPLAGADVSVGLWGLDTSREALLVAGSAQGEAALTGLAESTAAAARDRAIAGVVERRTKARDALFKQVQDEAYGPDKLLAALSRCVNCHNCRDACPVCYCRECVFDSTTFEWEGDRYVGRAARRGALRMPADTLLFHLTRMNHMATSCVGCGMCSEACPNDVPVARLFKLVGARTQQVVEYVPGRSLDEALPLSTFREDEFQEMGG